MELDTSKRNHIYKRKIDMVSNQFQASSTAIIAVSYDKDVPFGRHNSAKLAKVLLKDYTMMKGKETRIVLKMAHNYRQSLFLI